MPDNKDIQIIVFLVILTFISVVFYPLNATPVRTILGVLMVLFIPGYALIAALFPKKGDIDGIERFALSLGLSIAIVPLIGLVLNFTPFGIRPLPVLVSLSLFTLVMCLAAYFRRMELPENERFTVHFSELHSSTKGIMDTKSGKDKVLTIILILSIIVSIFMLIYVIATPKQGEKFTEFYILGDNGKAEGYPSLMEAGKDSSVIVGIVNHEYIPVNYTLEISLNNDSLSTRRIQLMYNSTWEERVVFTPRERGDDMMLQFLLFKEGNFTEPYRDLQLQVDVK
ncbi:MAG: DUF1616 domain-containing protein [Candidatus Methanoperedens sp.]|nr:DUF1616 domain-containing protein [Candidatus Methanoperedens sp.]